MYSTYGHYHLFKQREIDTQEKITGAYRFTYDTKTDKEWAKKYFAKIQKLEDTVTFGQHVRIFHTQIIYAREMCVGELLYENCGDTNKYFFLVKISKNVKIDLWN